MGKAGENTLGRLSEVLFEELERLNAMDTSDREAASAEIERAKAIQGVARELNSSAKTILDTAQLRAEWAGSRMARTPRMLEG
jgi:hypothetical protein